MLLSSLKRAGDSVSVTGFMFLVISVCISIAGITVTPDSAIAGDAELMRQKGKQLFEREWKHSPAANESDQELAANAFVRMSEAGDGLGPMFNAKSCVACHDAGGGADVNRNVTLLTVDPRSPALEDTIVLRGMRSKETTLENVRSLFPGLITPSGKLVFEVVVHEQSTDPAYERLRSSLVDGVPHGVEAQWFNSDSRTSQAIATRPVIAGRRDGLDFYLSQRNSPPLFGLGLIDKIKPAILESIAKGQANRSNGKISGRVGVGKFGWRAQTETLEKFVHGACAGEVGLQLRETPQPSNPMDERYVSLGLDLYDHEVDSLVTFVRSLPKPKYAPRESTNTADARDGRRLFVKVGCADCHIENVFPADGIFSDLLLHDMGDLLQAPSPAPISRTSLTGSRKQRPRSLTAPKLSNPSRQFLVETNSLQNAILRSGRSPQRALTSVNRLSSTRASSSGYNGGPSGGPDSFTPVPLVMNRPAEPQFPYGNVPDEMLNTTSAHKISWDSLQREWRTPPLWGVADSAPYLHDGRAKTLNAAILWHDGEANEAATEYRTLDRSDRKKIITFLNSLKAPVHVRNRNEEADENNAWLDDVVQK